jgi:hypothetical protein
MKIKVNKKASVRSVVKVPHGFLVADNISIKPRKVKTGNGCLYLFRIKNTYDGMKIYIDSSLVKNGLVEFPILNAKAVRVNGNVYIIPSEESVVHFFLLGAVSGYEAHVRVRGNVSCIPFAGVDPRLIHFEGMIITTTSENGKMIVEYGLTHFGFYREEWDNAKQEMVIQ